MNIKKKCFILLSIFLIFFFKNHQFGVDAVEYAFDTGAKCEPYIGDPGNTTVCAPYLPYTSIYVGTGDSQTDMMNTVQVYISMLTSAGQASCRSNPETYRSLCSFFFLECLEYTNTTNSQVVTIPVRTCQENCVRSISACGVSSYYDCTQTFDSGGAQVPLYPLIADPAEFNMVTYGWPQELQIQCYNSTYTAKNNTVVPPPAVQCQEPLIYRNSSIYPHLASEDIGYHYITDDSDCLIPCPAPVFTRGQWRAFYVMTDLLSCLSAAASLLMIVTYGVLNRERTSYETILIFQNSAIFLRSLAGVMIAFAGGAEKVMCPDPGRNATEKDAICSASGIFFYGFSFYAILWWTFMVYDLWCILRKYRQLSLQFFFGISTILTIVVTFVAHFKGGWVADKGNVICWIADNSYSYGLFWAPMGLCLLLGTIWIGWIILEIYLLARTTNVGTDLIKKFIKAQVGPLTYICIFYATYLYIFIYNQSYHLQYQDIKAAGALEYFQCIYNAVLEDYSPFDCVVQGPKIGSYGTFAITLHIFGLYTLFYAFNEKFSAIWRDAAKRFFNWFPLTREHGLPTFFGNTSSSGTTLSGLSSTLSSGEMSAISLLPMSKHQDKERSRQSYNTFDIGSNNNISINSSGFVESAPLEEFNNEHSQPSASLEVKIDSPTQEEEHQQTTNESNDNINNNNNSNEPTILVESTTLTSEESEVPQITQPNNLEE